MQFEKRELSCLRQVIRGVKDQELTQEIRLTEDLPDVGRVLAGWGQVILRGKEWQGNHIAVSGGVQASVLYAPEDGTAPRSVDVWIPFQMKWDGAQTDREGPMRVQILLRFVDGRNLSARKILVRAGISCLAEGLTPHRTEVFRASEVPADVQLLRRSYPVRLPMEAGEKTFALEQTLETGTTPVQQIIACTLQPELSEARVSGDKVALRGTGRLHLVCSDREGRICSRDFEIPFSQLGELEKAYEQDAQADVMMAITSLELDPEEENLALKCGLVAQYMISDRTMLELVEDAYSTRRDVGLRQEELHLPVILDETMERVSARGEFPDMSLDGADAQFWPGHPRIRREGDRTELEIPGRFQILGYDREGNLRAACASWEGKNGLNTDLSSRVDAVTVPAGEIQWVNTGSAMEARGEIRLHTTIRSGQGMPMITALELGTLREPDRQRPTLILCRPGKRGLWEIAKDTGSTVRAIESANGIDQEPEMDRMLLIPIQ
ncbi:MAG: DUF3794 domain-containing protein [Oscillospiraceae bacterium]|nr:DUF3794 domain-containing protein [Oscillospiraceae bacterium]